MKATPWLNTRDRQGLIHYVASRPTDQQLGRTVCWKDFTWPVYSTCESASRWAGTEDPPSCFSCILMGPL